ncbi:MAG: tetratricopeptide repeat protein [Terriglobia bacterium]
MASNLLLCADDHKPAVSNEERLAQVDQLTKKADSLMARKFYEEAIHTYQEAVALNPRDPLMRNKLGIAYQLLPDLQSAKMEYEKARKLNPSSYEAWNNLGTVYYSLKRYPKAVKYYKKALIINSASATAYQNLGTAYFALDRYEEGFKAFQEAFRLDPTILDKLSSSGTVIRTAEVNQAIQNYYIAKLYAQQGQTEKALSYLLKAIENGFNDYDKITGDPDFKSLTNDERLTRLISAKPAAN